MALRLKAIPLTSALARRGEEDAYFYLRRRGCVMVAQFPYSPAWGD
jgi:hypothetical protein